MKVIENDTINSHLISTLIPHSTFFLNNNKTNKRKKSIVTSSEVLRTNE